jgi:hypothetical protein
MFVTPYQLALIAGGFTLLGALLGNWLSHYFSGNRDRRKEFNEAAEVLNIKLIAERNNASPFAHSPTDIEFELFSQHLPFWKRVSFDGCVKQYRKTKTDNQYTSSEYGDISYHDKDLIVSAVTELLKFTKRK